MEVLSKKCGKLKRTVLPHRIHAMKLTELNFGSTKININLLVLHNFRIIMQDYKVLSKGHKAIPIYTTVNKKCIVFFKDGVAYPVMWYEFKGSPCLGS
jgi:hypothetical protein